MGAKAPTRARTYIVESNRPNSAEETPCKQAENSGQTTPKQRGNYHNAGEKTEGIGKIVPPGAPHCPARSCLVATLPHFAILNMCLYIANGRNIPCACLVVRTALTHATSASQKSDVGAAFFTTPHTSGRSWACARCGQRLPRPASRVQALKAERVGELLAGEIAGVAGQVKE